MDYFNNLSYLISHIFLMLFIYLFIPHRYSKAVSRMICLTSFLLLGSTDILKLNIFPDSDLCYLVVTVFQIIVTQSTGLFLAPKISSKILFIGLSASNYTIIGSVIASILYIYTGNIPVSLAGNFLSHAAILLILYKSIHKIWLRQYEHSNSKSWWELCLIPSFFYCSFSCFAFFPHTLQEEPRNILGILCLMITMPVSYIVVLRYMESDSKRQDIYWKNVLFESYIKGLEDQYYLVEQSEKSIRILRHDIRHYTSMIEHLLDEEKYGEIRHITTHITAAADDSRIVKYCDNLMVNSIISKLVEQAGASDIRTNLELQIPREIPVNHYELAAVIANLFENAIICVRHFEPKKRYIDIRITCSREHLLIQMKNECQEALVFNPATGLPKSSKGAAHGLGMQSILAFSEKIDGNIDCFLENGMFFIILFAKFP